MARGVKAATAAGPVEGPWALPEGWRWEPLPNVADILDNVREPISSAERAKRIEGVPPSKLYPYYGATGQAGWIDDFLLDGTYVLLGEDGAPFLEPAKSKAYIVDGKCWVNNHAHILRAKSHYPAELLRHWLNIIDYRPFVNGTTRLKLTQGAMKEMPVPAPPSEQVPAIASRIDTLFAEVAAGEEALAAAKASLGQWRQALLKAAVTGDLTADWRASNPPAETGEALLARILGHRRSRWTQDPRNKGKHYPEPPPPDTTTLPPLPDGWAWASLKQVAELNPSITPPAVGEVPFLPMAAVGAETGRVDASERRDVAKVKTGFTRFAAGDVLFAKITPCMENGKIAVVPDEVGTFGAGSTEFHVIRSRWLPPSFLWAYLVQQATRQEAERNMTGTAGQMRVPKSYLETLAVPIGPRPELEAAIEKLTHMNGQTNPIEAAQQDGVAKAELLRQSILAAAFRGALAA